MSFFTHLLSKNKKLSSYIKQTFGFYPNNINLFKLALRHRSAGNGKFKDMRLNNERLEYLGDAVLNTIVAEYLFKTYPSKPEGFLTEMRSRIVSRKSLNKLSQKLGFEKLIDRSDTAHKMANSLGGNALEAITGAIFIDQGYKKTYKALIDNIIKKHINVKDLEHTETNFKSRILEWSQKNRKELKFNLLGEEGKCPDKFYEVELTINDKQYATATDRSIKSAEQKAAQITIQQLEKEGLFDLSNKTTGSKSTQ